MISQVSSVSFLVCTLLCMESWSTDSWVWSQNRGSVRDTKGLNITVRNANANLPEAAKFYNSIFDPPNAAPCTMPPGADAPFAPFLPPLKTLLNGINADKNEHMVGFG